MQTEHSMYYLNSPLKVSFERLLHDVVENVGVVMFDAYEFIIYHITRCLEESIVLPKLCQTLYTVNVFV